MTAAKVSLAKNALAKRQQNRRYALNYPLTQLISRVFPKSGRKGVNPILD
ncbi:MAG: hypothetical protein LBF22_08105 [Deltaproteobacteria bacterium]|nr:hypothetical protein [Deltaproteobacteria bacterium]